MPSELLPVIRRILSDAREAGLDSLGQMQRAVAEVLRLTPHLAPADALRVVHVAQAH
ncbi:MAG: hypothetical protein H7Y60_00865 [Rhodospirillaceae bacterium]|nr:hypothetical protein [Rhodospirillales bacterium]